MQITNQIKTAAEVEDIPQPGSPNKQPVQESLDTEKQRPTTPDTPVPVSPTGHSILYEPYSQYLDWQSPSHVADWTLTNELFTSTPEGEGKTKFFPRTLIKVNEQPLNAEQTRHNRRVRYEMRTGQSRDDTIDGMKSTKTPPLSPV